MIYTATCFICATVNSPLHLVAASANDKSTISVISDYMWYDLMHNIKVLDVHSTTGTESVTDSTANEVLCVGVEHHPAVITVLWIVLTLIAFATAGGNFLVILAVLMVRKLRTPSNILIVSLAFSDLLVGILVLPFTIIDAIEGYWPFNEGLCDMYISFDVLLCTASILNLCAISIDRYLVITRPLTYANKRTTCRMAEMIAAAWIISALISIPPNFGWKPPYVECKCEYSKNAGYQIYATFCAFYLPLLVMLVLYGKIFKLAREMARAESHQLSPSNPEVPNLRNGKHEEANSQKTVGMESAVTIPTRTEYLFPLCNRPHSNEDGTSCFSSDRSGRSTCNSSAFQSKIIGKFQGHRSPKMLDPNSSLSVGAGSSISAEHVRRKIKSTADSKVVRTLGIIMGCFCLCWLPFFIVQLFRALMKASGFEDENMIPVSVFRLLQWLGYINSFLNPFIYAKFNREFRQPFQLILSCRCRKMNARLRSVAFTDQHGLPVGGMGGLTGFNLSASTRVDRRSLLRTSTITNSYSQPTCGP